MLGLKSHFSSILLSRHPLPVFGTQIRKNESDCIILNQCCGSVNIFGAVSGSVSESADSYSWTFLWPLIKICCPIGTDTGTVKVGNFDHLMTFKIILKLFPNSFLTIFLHGDVRVLWYFWDPNLNTRFGSQKYYIFF